MALRRRKIFINTGTVTTPVWLLVGRRESVKRPRSQSTTEHDFAESNHTKTVFGNVKMGLEFEYFERPDDVTDPVLAALVDAAENGAILHVAFVDGDIATAGTKGIQGMYGISDSPVEDPINDRTKHSFTLMEADEYVDGEVFDVQPWLTPA